MSTALGLAATAATLQQILLAGFTRLKVDDVLGLTAKVTCVSPAVFDLDTEHSRLNLFLYNQTRNTGRFNEGLPSRDSRGDRIANPALALDLHYLITAHANADFHAEILLGAAMQILHETPGLGRDAIRNALKPNAATKPNLPKALETAGLADQLEQLRIAPLNLTTDEVSRIWSAIQVPGRPGAAYLVSVLLLESQLSARVPLPVRERRLYSLPLRSPRIDRVENEASAGSPIVPSSIVKLRGNNLAASTTQLRVNELDFTSNIIDMSDELLTFRLTAGPLRAGICTVLVSQPAPVASFDSNLGVFILNPEATFALAAGTTSKVVDGTTYRTGRMDVVCTPALGIRQRVRLLLNEKDAPSDRAARAYAFNAADGNGITPPAQSTATVSIAFTSVAAGKYLARLQVDEGSSPLTLNNGLLDGPEVTV